MSHVALDESQRAAADVAPEVRQVVLAGPGSGKTEVVAALVENLVTAHDLDPDYELLVISFSRAAVRAVTRRLKDADIPASGSVRTLDALAAQIVVEATGCDVARISFDARVEAATRVLQDGLWGGTEDLRHLVVDEVQDVVGLRAELLLALIAAVDPGVGFTLLGDPAQAIYDFQLRSKNDTTGSELLRRARQAGSVRVVPLMGSYRALTRDARAAVALRHGASIDLVDAYWPVRDFVEDLVAVDAVDDLLPVLRAPGGTSAVLTETNGEALLLAHELWERDVPAIVRRPAKEPVVDRWVAEVLGSRPSWKRDDFASAHDDDSTARLRWKALRSLARPGGAEIDTLAVAAALSSRRPLAGELVAADDAGPVVSTVHRAKGLEFDTVVVAQFPSREDDERNDHERTRVLYVAVTRARARLFRLPRQRVYGLTRDSRTDRWIRTGREKWKTSRFEMRGGDADRSEPPAGDDAEAAQGHLAAQVRGGDPLVLRYNPYSSSFDAPVYLLEHDGVVVGRTSEDFGRDLARRLGGSAEKRKLAWPRLIGAHVECVETVAGPPQRHRSDGVGRDGLWLGVRPVGLLTLRWSGDE